MTIVLIATCAAALAANEKSKTEAQSQVFLRGLQSMCAHPKTRGPQDIDPSLFEDFWLKWELVTARYKPDGKELRFIYVNKIGAETLAKGTYPFPEGTVFAKIGAEATHDPLFDNSLVPGDINRVQIMLKKAADPKARDGWVYALYLGAPFNGHLTHDEIESCAACHAMAQPRDMVFSLPFLTPFGAAPAPMNAAPFRDQFRAMSIEKLPPVVRGNIASLLPDVKSAMRLSMPVFNGSLFEARELLADFARTSRVPYLLNSPDEHKLLLAVPQDKCVSMINIRGPGEQAEKWDICADAQH